MKRLITILLAAASLNAAAQNPLTPWKTDVDAAITNQTEESSITPGGLGAQLKHEADSIYKYFTKQADTAAMLAPYARTSVVVPSARTITINGTTLDLSANRSWTISGGSGGGTVTSASVVSANGFAGTVANATTTPAITLSTSITGVLKGGSGAISAAVAGTDYLAPAGDGSGLNGITKAQVGLSSVDNTPDASKPVSTAQASANAAVQAYAIQRANHTGAQAATTITQDATHRFVADSEKAVWNSVVPRLKDFNVESYSIYPESPGSETQFTTAFTQLLADVYAAHGGNIVFPRYGRYFLKIKFPAPNVLLFQYYSVTITGAATTVLNIGTAGGWTNQNDNSTIITTGVNSGDPVISVVGSGTSLIAVNLFNLDIQTPASPNVWGVDLRAAACAYVDNVLITPGQYPADVPRPYKSIGLLMPRINNGGQNRIGAVGIGGFDEGLYQGEHFTGSHVTIMFCRNATVVDNGLRNHPNLIERFQTASCQNVITFGPDGGRIRILQYDAEHSSGSNATNYDLLDSLNLGEGTIEYGTDRISYGSWNMFVRKGGARVLVNQIGQLPITLSNGELLSGAVPIRTFSTGWGDRGDNVYMNANGSAGYATQKILAGEDARVCFKYLDDNLNPYVQKPWLGVTAPGGYEWVVGVEAVPGVPQPDMITYVPSTITHHGVALRDIWYSLKFTGSVVTAETSYDGVTWTVIRTFASARPAADLTTYMYGDGLFGYPQIVTTPVVIGGLGLKLLDFTPSTRTREIAPEQWVATLGGHPSIYGNYGRTTTGIDSAVSGRVQMQYVNATNKFAVLGLTTSSREVPYQNMDYYILSDGTNMYWNTRGGGTGSVAMTPGTYYGIQVDRTGSAINFVSSSDGVTFSFVATMATGATYKSARLNAVSDISGGGRMVKPYCLNCTL